MLEVRYFFFKLYIFIILHQIFFYNNKFCFFVFYYSLLCIRIFLDFLSFLMNFFIFVLSFLNIRFFIA